MNTILPQSPDAEQGALCSLLLSPRDAGCAAVEIGVEPAWFACPANATIFSALMDRWQKGEPMDFITLTAHLRAIGGLEAAGGASYVTELFSFLPTAAFARQYLETLREHHLRREIIQAATALASRAYDPTEDISGLLGDIAEWSGTIGRRKSKSKTTAKEHVMDLLEQLSGATETASVLTGLEALDELTGGWEPGNLVIVASETKGGKSAFMLNVIEENCIRTDRTAAIFSLEMSGKENVSRLISSLAPVCGMAMRRRKVSIEQMTDINRAAARICDSKVDIITDARTLPEMTARAVQLHAQRPLDIVCLDYIQLLGGISKDGENREREVASVSRGMKALAERLGCVVIALSQLNDKGLLRESRAIGQDANCVLGILASDEPGVKFVEVVAQRSGPSGDCVPVAWRPSYTHFKNLERNHPKWKSEKKK